MLCVLSAHLYKISTDETKDFYVTVFYNQL